MKEFMGNFHKKKRNKSIKIFKNESKKNEQSSGGQDQNDTQENINLDLNSNITNLKQHFAKCSDLVYREFSIFHTKKAVLIYIDGLIDANQLELHLLKQLMTPATEVLENARLNQLLEQNVTVAQTTKMQSLAEVIDHVLVGEAVMLIDGESSAIALSTKKWDHRAVEEPLTEAVIRGSREGFTENIRTNTALLRRRIRTENLKNADPKYQ